MLVLHQLLVVLSQKGLLSRAHILLDRLGYLLGELERFLEVHLLVSGLLQDYLGLVRRGRTVIFFVLLLLWIYDFKPGLFLFFLLLELLPGVRPLDGLLLDEFEL